MMTQWWLRICGVMVFVLAGTWEGAQAKERVEQRPAASDRNWQIGFTPSYSSGNFGTNSTSEFFYGPWSIRRYFKDGDVSLVIPFVVATTDGQSTFVDGRVQRVDKSVKDTVDNIEECKGKGKGSCLTGRGEGQNVTTAGLGDIVLRGRYYVFEEQRYLPLVAVTARMKLPTANASQGLGTGAFDHGYGVEISKLIGEKWLAFSMAGIILSVTLMV